ncbi:MAG: outer membrane beta-barrel protein, partial [Salegentibacter sp.]
KYVNFQRLLEAEVGFTRNEPVQLAVKEAIEKAVKGLVVEGIEDGLWSPKEPNAADKLVQDYKDEKEEAALTKLYDRKYVERNKSSLSLDLGGALISGDYSNSEAGALVRLAYNAGISPSFALNLAVSGFELRNKNSFSEKFASLDVNGKFLLLPNDNFGPYLYAGPGVMMNIDSGELPEGIGNTHFKLQYGLGLEYLISPKLGLKAFAEHNIALDDELDYVINGKRDDHFFNFGVGVNFYLGKSKQEKNK